MTTSSGYKDDDAPKAAIPNDSNNERAKTHNTHNTAQHSESLGATHESMMARWSMRSHSLSYWGEYEAAHYYRT